MKNAELLSRIAKFYEEHQITITPDGKKVLYDLIEEAHCYDNNEGLPIPFDVTQKQEEHIERLINNFADRFAPVIEAHITAYKNHIERELNLSEEQLKNLEFLTIVAVIIARSGFPSGRDLHSPLTQDKETQIIRAAKMVSVYSGGESFFLKDGIKGLRIHYVCPIYTYPNHYDISKLINFASILINTRRAEITSRAEERAKIPPVTGGNTNAPFVPMHQGNVTESTHSISHSTKNKY